VAYEKKGDLGQAEASFSNALSIESDDCKRLQAAWEARGRVRQALGKTAEARTDFDRCRELSTTTPEGKQCLRALSQLGAGGAKSPPVM
jgi:predicted RNA polymerase sigma factor